MYNEVGDFMSKKTLILIILAIIVAGLAAFVVVNKDSLFPKKEPEVKEEEPSNTEKTEDKKTTVIDYKKYQELRSGLKDDETYAILIVDLSDTGKNVSNDFKKEVLRSFQNRKSEIYEIDINKLDEVSLSGVITDVTKVMNYKEPSLTTPTLLVSKKGKIVYKQAGLIYSDEITTNLDKNKIE